MPDKVPPHSREIFSKKILLVDDSASLRELARSILISEGFEHVDEANNGQRALEMIGANTYDILISDWHMPVLDGLGLFEAIHDLPNQNKPLFILLTSVSEKEKVMSAIQLGIKYYIVKPFKPITLFQQVLSCIQKQKAA